MVITSFTCSMRALKPSRLTGWLIGILIFFGQIAVANGVLAEVESIRTGNPHDSLYDISFNAGTGIAVGAYGTILLSADGGKTWVEDSGLDLDTALLGTVVRRDISIVVGQMGKIGVKNLDGWKLVDTNTTERLMSVDMNDTGLAVAVGGFGTLLLSSDAGNNWITPVINWLEMLEDYSDPHLYDVHVSDAGTITVVGEFALIVQSQDDGKNWRMLHKGDNSLFSLALNEKGEGYAVGQKGFVIRAGENASLWQVIPSGTEAHLLGVLQLDNDTVVVTGIRVLRYSQNSGKSWRNVVDGDKDLETGWYQTVVSNKSPDPMVFLVGHQGRILRLNSLLIHKNKSPF